MQTHQVDQRITEKLTGSRCYCPGQVQRLFRTVCKTSADLTSFVAAGSEGRQQTYSNYLHGSACGDTRDKVFAPICLASKEAMDFISPDYRQQSLTIVNELPDISIIPGETLATSFFRTQVADIRHDAYGILRGRYNATDWTEITNEHSKLPDVECAEYFV